MPVERTVSNALPDKICTVCGERYTPTGRHQVKCGKCTNKKSPEELAAGVPDHAVLTTNIDEILNVEPCLEDFCEKVMEIAEGVIEVSLRFKDITVTIKNNL